MDTSLMSPRKMSFVAEESYPSSEYHNIHKQNEMVNSHKHRIQQDDILYRRRLDSLTNTLKNMGHPNVNAKSHVIKRSGPRGGFRRDEIQRKTSQLVPLSVGRKVSTSEDRDKNTNQADIAWVLDNNTTREDSSQWSRDETFGSSRTDVTSASLSIQNPTSTQNTSRVLPVTHRHTKLSKYKKKKRGFMRTFAKIGKFVCVLIGLWRKHAIRVKDFLNNVDLVSVDTITDLLFDKTDYSSDKQARISMDTKRILSMLPVLRSEKDIKYVEIALRNYSELAAYPVSIQTLIAKKAWYERYIGRRVIIKQGHVARCFYFILSGKVVVSQIGEDSTTSHTLTYLNRGDSFGELGVLGHCTRTATVISEGTVEFLVVTDEDYEDIFKSGEVTEKHFPFLESLICFHDWPVELLTNDTTKAFIAYSKRGAVLCDNTEESQWIYIIQSGSVTVLKKLKMPKKVTKKKGTEKRMTSMQQLTEEDHVLHLQNTIRHETRGLSKRDLRARYHRFIDLQLGAHVTRTVAAAATSCLSGQRMNAIDEVSSTNEPPMSKAVHVTNVSRGRKMTGWQMGPLVTRTGMVPLPRVGEDDTSSAGAEIEMLDHSDVPLSNSSLRVNLGRQQMDIAEQNEEGSKETFVTVQTLVKGDVFGLAELIHGKQPTFSLISNGAECIMVDRRLYWEKAMDSQKLTRKLKDEVLAYPTDEKMQSDLVVDIDWQKYKQKALRKALKHAIKKKRFRRLQAMGMFPHMY